MSQIVTGKHIRSAEHLLDQLIKGRFASRLFEKDSTLWGPDAQPDAVERLGWLDVFAQADTIVREVERLKSILQTQGLDRVVLSGMGGSSLAPEAIAKRDGVPLIVLDSTHPQQVTSALAELQRTVLVVSSKSGSTVETRSHLATFEEAFRSQGINPAERIIIVTDPGSQLDVDAKSEGYRVFLADPNVGGRYSALTAFGLVPSVLAGVDGNRLVSEAQDIVEALKQDTVTNPALQLGTLLAAQLPEAFTFGVYESSPHAPQLGDWIEQLIAESSGKHGRGMLPIHLPSDAPEILDAQAGEPLPANMFLVKVSSYSSEASLSDRSIRVSGTLGAQLLIWSVATTVLCHLCKVNPFDQPDVEAAKVAARAALQQAQTVEASAVVNPVFTGDFFAEMELHVTEQSFIAIQAFLPEAHRTTLERVRDLLVSRFHVPVSLGMGPRYLHSTGQFHKGGPQRGVYVQIVDEDMPSLPIPGSDSSFAELIASQAAGDREVLRERGHTVLTVTLHEIERLLQGTES